MEQEVCHFWEGDVLMEVWYEKEVREKEVIWRKVHASERPCQCEKRQELEVSLPKGGSK